MAGWERQTEYGRNHLAFMESHVSSIGIKISAPVISTHIMRMIFRNPITKD
jgi:hypothetical protein